MEIKLKPCPFCGRKAMEVENWKIKGGILYGVRCVHCHAVTGYYEDEKDAFKAWNKRAEQPEIIRCKNCKHIVFAIEKMSSEQLEIIRCKDCKHWDGKKNGGFCEVWDDYISNDAFFCGNSKRREEDG